MQAGWCKPGYDPSQNSIKICQAVPIHKYIRYDNPENFRLISCTD